MLSIELAFIFTTATTRTPSIWSYMSAYNSVIVPQQGKIHYSTWSNFWQLIKKLVRLTLSLGLCNFLDLQFSSISAAVYPNKTCKTNPGKWYRGINETQSRGLNGRHILYYLHRSASTLVLSKAQKKLFSFCLPCLQNSTTTGITWRLLHRIRNSNTN